MLEILFFICLFGIVHTYILYPLTMLILGKVYRKKAIHPKNSSTDYPTVEVIFAAYNEEDVIEQKIRSTFNTSYPASNVTVRIGSDASTDKTDSLVEKLQQTYPNLHFKRFNTRTGKAGIVNKLVQESQADNIILTDANILFERETIAQLVSGLHDLQTGIVGDRIVYKEVKGTGISKQENVYLGIENAIKQSESDVFGATMGVEGGCYIIRRHLFPQIPPLFFMEDFYITMAVMRQNYKVKFLATAQCHEDVSVLSTEEYKRKVRISIGNFQNLAAYRSILFTHFFPAGFIFLSHKVLRWFTPFFLLALIPLSVMLAPTGLFYELFAVFYAVFLGLGLMGILFSQSKKAGFLKYPGHFVHMNLALLEGFTLYLKGVKSNAWQPTRRNQE